MPTDETSLEHVTGISREVVSALSARWITSVEQLVAIGNSDAGVRSLASELGTSEDDVRSLLDAARRALDPATVARLERPVDTSRRPLGARKPDRPPSREDERG
jgi:hypothetical protein